MGPSRGVHAVTSARGCVLLPLLKTRQPPQFQVMRLIRGLRWPAPVRSRIPAGYSDVSELTKDDNGIRRGKATKRGTVQEVQVDFRGSVTSK